MTQVTDEMLEAFDEGYSQARREGKSSRESDCASIQALLDAKLISLPADEAAIRESVVREAMAMIPERVPQCNSTFDDAWNSVIDTLNREFQSLLPTKDRAEELVREYEADVPAIERSYGGLARWLIEREG